MTNLKMRPNGDGPHERQFAGSMGPNVCLPQELFQETLDSLHYALRMQESLEYRLPTKQQQAEFQEDLVMLLEKLEGYRQKGETGEASSSKTWQDSVSTNGRDEPSVAEDAASRGSEEGPKQTIDELEEAMRVQAEEMEQLKLQLSMTTKLFEQLGASNLVNLLRSEDTDICRTATKALANLAAQESFQEEIVQVGGLKGLFDLIEKSVDEITHRLAAGAVANLAVNEANQTRIVEEGGLPTLCELGRSSADPQTQKMVAGAIANLCGNAALKETLVESGSMRKFLSMAATRQVFVLEQVARGIANFVVKNDRLDGFLKEGGLRYLIRMATSSSIPVRKHVGLALYSLAQKEAPAMQIVQATGAIDFLVELKMQDNDSMQRMAEKTLSCLLKFDDCVQRLIEAAESRLQIAS